MPITIDMVLTEEEKQKIEEEETYRQQVREGEEYRKQLNTKPAKKSRAGKLFLILIFVTIVAGIMLSRTTSQTSTPEVADVPVSQKPKQSSNIGISRDKIINTFKNENGYTFSQGNLVNGEENYVGTKGKGVIQLLGPGDSLSSASFTAFMGFDPDGTVSSSVLAQSEMVLFASTIDKSCSDWLVGEMTKMSADVTQAHQNQEVACGRNLSYYYIPGDSATFGVEPH